MMLKGFAVLLAISLVALLAAVACGDGDEGAGETPEAAETPAADETPEAGETPAADGTADDEGLQQLESLAGEAAAGITAKVTYRVATETAGEATEQEWVLVQRPPDYRYEIATTEGGEESRIIIISAAGKSYLCTSAAGQESCLATEATEEETAPFDPLFSIPQELAKDTAGVDITDESHRQIAGVDATCFTVSGALSGLGEGQGEVCFSDDGLLLYLGGETAGETFTFEATSVSTDVTDADFEPPYEVTELPEFEIPTPS